VIIFEKLTEIQNIWPKIGEIGNGVLDSIYLCLRTDSTVVNHLGWWSRKMIHESMMLLDWIIWMRSSARPLWSGPGRPKDIITSITKMSSWRRGNYNGGHFKWQFSERRMKWSPQAQLTEIRMSTLPHQLLDGEWLWWLNAFELLLLQLVNHTTCNCITKLFS
jgi:hypothetical protein